MNRRARHWFEDLRQHVADNRIRTPIPLRPSLSLADEEKCKIIGGGLIAWLESAGAEVFNQRAMFSRLAELEPDAFVFVVTDAPGLVAAGEILGHDHPGVEVLLLAEHRALPPNLADHRLKWHIEYQTYFHARVERINRDDLKPYPKHRGERFWIHVENTITGPNMGFGLDHMWKWDGAKATLVREELGRRIY